jgi:hypothetical protein
MKCLDEEDFSRYLDGEFDDAEREGFSAHIAFCRSCRERLNDMEHAEHRIREAFAGRGLKAQTVDTVKASPCPSEQDLLGYLAHGLSLQETEGIERHLKDCDLCIGHLSILSKIKMSLGLLKEIEPVPQELKDTVLRGWQRGGPEREERVQKESPLRLAIRIAATGLEILRASIVPQDMELDLVSSPAFAGNFRSEENASQSVGSEVIVAKKQIVDKDLNVELVIRKESDQQVSLVVKLLKGELPFSDARVSLLKDRLLFHSKKTGSKGDVEFTSIPPGDYVLKIPSELIQWPIEIKDH